MKFIDTLMFLVVLYGIFVIIRDVVAVGLF